MAQELTAEENALLVGGLGKVGATVNSGGGWGARLAAKLLPADVFETEVALPLPAAEAEARVRAVLGVPAGPLRAMMGAGAMGLNPAVVTVTLTATGPDVKAPGAVETAAAGPDVKAPGPDGTAVAGPDVKAPGAVETAVAGPDVKAPGAAGRTGTAGTTVHIRGVAKEGLIKQHAGREAAENVAEGIRRG